MNFFKMFLQTIEYDKQKFTAYVKKNGYIENLGQIEYSDFCDKINKNDNLTYSEKADLRACYTDMLSNL